MKGGYKALVKLRDEGVIKAFGAGVNEWEVAEILARRGDFDLFLLAGRYTLLEQEALESFLPLCDSRGIGIVLGGPYNSGILATGPVPGAWYNYDPAPAAIRRSRRSHPAHLRGPGVGLSETALRFPLLHPSVVSVIPGASSPDEVGPQRARPRRGHSRPPVAGAEVAGAVARRRPRRAVRQPCASNIVIRNTREKEDIFGRTAALFHRIV